MQSAIGQQSIDVPPQGAVSPMGIGEVTGYPLKPPKPLGRANVRVEALKVQSTQPSNGNGSPGLHQKEIDARGVQETFA